MVSIPRPNFNRVVAEPSRVICNKERIAADNSKSIFRFAIIYVDIN